MNIDPYIRNEITGLIRNSKGRLRMAPLKKLLGYYRSLKSPRARADAIADNIQSWQFRADNMEGHGRSRVWRV